jgi:hypothetical protein
MIQTSVVLTFKNQLVRRSDQLNTSSPERKGVRLKAQ